MRCGAFYVCIRSTRYIPRLFLAHVADTLGRDTDYEASGRELAAFGDDGSGGDYGTRTDLGTVQNRGVHAYQAVVFYAAAVDYGFVADDACFTDYRRVAGVGMEDCAVLDVGAGADAYGFGVAAQHGSVPDARFFTQTHLADYESAGGDPG